MREYLGPVSPHEKLERNQQIFADWQAGVSAKKIAEKHQIGVVRVRQIYHRQQALAAVAAAKARKETAC
jgi:Mor family transcriptional regulator